MNASEIAQSRIDLELARLSETMRARRSRRNEFAPISRLQPEILAEIFCFLSSMYGEGNHPENCYRASHVSQQWYKIALNCPRMWVRISTSRPAWTIAMLERSKSQPIILDSNSGNRCYETAIKEFHRVKELYLNGKHHRILNLAQLVRGPAPLLETFQLQTHPSDICHSVPFKLSSSVTPRLKTLTLSAYNLRWNSPLPSGLTTLYIKGIGNPSRPTLSQLLQALRHTQLLEDLTLEECLPILLVPRTDEAQTEVIHLPHLEAFSLIGMISECTQILEHVSFPANVELSLEMPAGPACPGIISRLADLIERHIASTNTLQEPMLDIYSWEADFSNNTSMGMYISSTHESFPVVCPFSLDICNYTRPPELELFKKLVGAIISTQALEIVEHFRFSTRPPLIAETEAIFEVFRQAKATRVHTLDINETPASEIIRYLSSDATGKSIEGGPILMAENDGTSSPTLMPSLKNLLLWGTQYSDDDLIKMLRYRDQLGLRIIHLKLAQRRVESSLAKELSQFVEVIDWER